MDGDRAERRGESRALATERWHHLAVELRDLLWLPPALRPRVAISRCLLGEPVRWDGGHKLAEELAADLAEWAEPVAICPEVESGLSVPRPPLVIVHDAAPERGGAVRLVERESGRDATESLARFATARLAELAPLDGWIGKSKSPSCALRGVAVVAAPGAGAPVVASGGGLFARALAAAHPSLPRADERELCGAVARAAFRLAAEWQLGWRFTASRAERGIAIAKLHRKLRGFWLAVEPQLARTLDRAADAGAGGGAGGGAGEGDGAARYAKAAAVRLYAIVARVVRRGG
ncbi:MAG: DUF523 domain-containing protein [Planctomycetes bacterium]|nr:DUF523 domain-containing protein [Planctomycetota bacterium]